MRRELVQTEKIMDKITLPQVGTEYFTLTPDFSHRPTEYKLLRMSWSNSILDRLRFLGRFYLTRKEAETDARRLNNLLRQMENGKKN